MISLMSLQLYVIKSSDVTQGHLTVISMMDSSALIYLRDVYLVSGSCSSEERRLLKTVPKKGSCS